jgi:hypothetical protein
MKPGDVPMSSGVDDHRITFAMEFNMTPAQLRTLVKIRARFWRLGFMRCARYGRAERLAACALILDLDDLEMIRDLDGVAARTVLARLASIGRRHG